MKIPSGSCQNPQSICVMINTSCRPERAFNLDTCTICVFSGEGGEHTLEGPEERQCDQPDCSVTELEEVSVHEREQHLTRRQLQIPKPFFEPTRKFMGTPDNIVNVSFLHPRPTKPHHTRECFEERQSDQPAWLPILLSIWEEVLGHECDRQRTSVREQSTTHQFRIELLNQSPDP